MSTIKVTNLRHEDATADNITLTSTDRVGIGTASPAVTVHAEDAQCELQLKSTSGTNSAGLRFVPGGETNALYIYADGSRNINIDNHATSIASFRAGGGLTFNGDTATANALDDYEEGTYTPALSGGGYTYTSGSYTEGRYTKVGRLVTVEAHYNINAISGSSNGSPTRITLPFAPSALYTAGRWCQVLCRLVYFNSSAIQRVYCAQLTTNSSSADIVYYYTSGGSGTDQPVDIGADWQSSSTNGQIVFVMTYVTAA
jgi:hypothetical protein